MEEVWSVVKARHTSALNGRIHTVKLVAKAGVLKKAFEAAFKFLYPAKYTKNMATVVERRPVQSKEANRGGLQHL